MEVSPANRTLADNLRRLMAERNLTQKEVEALSGVKQTTISLYTRPEARNQGKDGKAGSAKLTELEQVAGAFGLGAWELLRPYSAEHAQANNELERQLLSFFRQMPEEKQDALVAMANGWANLERPNQANPANPYPNAPAPGVPTKEMVAAAGAMESPDAKRVMLRGGVGKSANFFGKVSEKS